MPWHVPLFLIYPECGTMIAIASVLSVVKLLCNFGINEIHRSSKIIIVTPITAFPSGGK
jgi:hypothetical protein